MLKLISFDRLAMTAGSESATERSAYPLLFIVTDGHAVLGKQRLGISEGIFVRAGVSLRIKPDVSDDCSIIKLTLDGEDNDDALRDRGLTENAVYFSVTSLPKLLTLADMLCNVDEYAAESLYFEAAARLFLSFVRTNDVDGESYGNAYVDRAARYINDNISGVIRVEELALSLGVDRMYLRNLFVKYTGMSTMEYVMHTRMERAKVLLGNKHLSVTKIADEVGYPDILSFSKAFKKYSGVCPSEFRDMQTRRLTKPKKKEQIPVFIL